MSWCALPILIPASGLLLRIRKAGVGIGRRLIISTLSSYVMLCPKAGVYVLTTRLLFCFLLLIKTTDRYEFSEVMAQQGLRHMSQEEG